MIFFSCTKDYFTPSDTSHVRWLHKESDYEVARWYWQQLNSPLSYQTWITAHTYGYQYAVVTKEGKPISTAGVWRFSDHAWEVAAVSTLSPYRRQGYAKQVVSFVTAYILASECLATCSTEDSNMAMIATAKSVGFQVIAKEAVWWQFPDLPDF